MTPAVAPAAVRRTTPGLIGYIVAVLVAIVVQAVLVAFSAVFTDGALDALLFFVLALLYVGVVAVPSALVAVPIVHLACRRVEAQWVHVLAAGLAGAGTGLAFVLLVDATFEGAWAWYLVGATALSTTCGRLAVLGLVPRPVAGAAVGRRPVDDDFAGTPPRW